MNENEKKTDAEIQENLRAESEEKTSDSKKISELEARITQLSESLEFVSQQFATLEKSFTDYQNLPTFSAPASKIDDSNFSAIKAIFRKK